LVHVGADDQRDVPDVFDQIVGFDPIDEKSQRRVTASRGLKPNAKTGFDPSFGEKPSDGLKRVGCGGDHRSSFAELSKVSAVFWKTSESFLPAANFFNPFSRLLTVGAETDGPLLLSKDNILEKVNGRASMAKGEGHRPKNQKGGD